MEFANGDWLRPVTWFLFTNTFPVYNNTIIEHVNGEGVKILHRNVSPTLTVLMQFEFEFSMTFDLEK